jgi:hypothetical protein
VPTSADYRIGFRQNIRQENSEILQTRTTVYRTGFRRLSGRTGHQEMLYRKTAKSVKREIRINLDKRMPEWCTGKHTKILDRKTADYYREEVDIELEYGGDIRKGYAKLSD